jgi:hypothetical protein
MSASWSAQTAVSTPSVQDDLDLFFNTLTGAPIHDVLRALLFCSKAH